RPQKLVLIPLPEGFNANGISGTTILGGSQLGMIIEPFELVAMACGTPLDANAYSSASSVVVDAPVQAPGAAPAAGEAAPARTGPSAGAPAQAPDVTVPAKPSSAPELGEGLAEQFFIEISGILKELNEDIFQLEKEPESAPRVNTIFRHFHSIKGNFMMTGFTSVGAFVHDVESVLDRIREKELAVSQAIIDILLDAVKLLEAGLAEIQAGRGFEITDADLMERLAALRQRSDTTVRDNRSGGEAQDDDVFHFSPLGMLLFHAKMAAPDISVYQSMIQLLPSFQDSSLIAYLIIRRLTMVADIIDSAPSLERIEKGIVRDKMKIMFASRLSLEEVNRFFKNQLQRYYSVGTFENLKME
ncbi:MAG: Hpt domain-containing protein, partial [Planctomycetota bacterium]|nr:Hpt domain-containing protein [Planctomycetota bacterium]